MILSWEERMNLQYLRIFLAVAEHEHITRASQELILSQPAVTKTIQHLEQEVGLDLIERHGRRIVLTHAGRVLHTYARRLFALERDMEDALAALRDVDAGEITLAASTTTGVYLLPPVIARFHARYPQVALHMSILNSHEIIEQTLNWNLDFGLVEGEAALLPSELKVEVFAHDELVLVVSPRHRWCGVQSLPLESLCDNVLVLREQGSGIREVIEHALSQHDVQVHPLLTVPDNEAIKHTVMSGMGASIVSALTVQRELAAGELIRVPLEGLELRPELSIVQRVDKQLSRAAQAFYSFIRTIEDL
jgi:DNA-binding transcriptional LysR family regulator